MLHCVYVSHVSHAYSATLYACEKRTQKKRDKISNRSWLRDEMLLMGTSDQLVAECYKYCGEEPRLIRSKSCADGDGEENERV